MSQNELLTNGSFSAPPLSWNGTAQWIIVSGPPGAAFGWTGTDIEWGLDSVYRTGGSTTSRVIEMDGNRNAITSIQQSFSVSGEVNAWLSFDMALRSGQPPTAGEGFTLTILDSNGGVVLRQDFLPTNYAWETVSLIVPFPDAGQYTIRFTEIGPDNSFGAILDNVSLTCFTAGTLIDTPDGPRRVEELRPGDLVLTLDDGPQPIRWVGRRTVTLGEMLCDPRLRPVTIKAGAFGTDLPARDLRLSRQHRVLRSGWECELHFAETEVLVPAHRLVNGRSVRQGLPVQALTAEGVTYVHFCFDRHQIVFADGLPTESFYPSALSLQGVEADARDELLLIFPELRGARAATLDFARPVVDGKVAGLLA